MFSKAKVDDKVWSFVFGYGIITSTNHNNEYPIFVEFDNGESSSYTIDGRQFKDHSITLFWDEIKYEIPLQPKRKVKKWFAVFKSLSCKEYIPYTLCKNGDNKLVLFDSLEECQNDCNTYPQEFQFFEIEVEE